MVLGLSLLCLVGMCYTRNMGRVPSVESDSVARYGLQYIRPYHREFARRMVLGQKAVDICADLGVSEARFSIIINSPLFKIELKRLEEARDKGVADVTQTLRELSPLALEQVERTMYHAKSDRLRFDAAESILDRAGYGKSSKLEVKATHEHSSLTEEEMKKLVMERIQRIRDEASKKEAMEKEADAIDIEFETVDGCSLSEHSAKEKERVLPIGWIE